MKIIQLDQVLAFDCVKWSLLIQKMEPAPARKCYDDNEEEGQMK